MKVDREKALDILKAAQGLVVIGAALVAVSLYYFRWENTPISAAHLKLVSVEDCTGIFNISIENIGLVPFEVAEVFLASKVNDAQEEVEGFPQKVARGETISAVGRLSIVSSGVPPVFTGSLTYRIQQDRVDTWRTQGRAVALPKHQESC